METYKRASVVLETTRKRSKIALCSITKHNGVETTVVRELQTARMMQTTINDGLGFFLNEQSTTKPPRHQDMYIVTDDKIVKGDWYLNYVNGEFNGVFQADSCVEKEIDYRTWYEHNRKVVATTRPAILKISDIPTVSQAFIDKYIEKYNQQKPIDEVLIEVIEANFVSVSTRRTTIKGKALMLKTNPKDNTLIIKKLREQFSREETIEYMWEAYQISNTIFLDQDALRKEFDNWVKTVILY